MLNTILIVLLIITIYASIRSILKNKAKGITDCGICSSCTMAETCHENID